MIDQTGVIYEEFSDNLDDKLGDGRKRYILENIKVGQDSPEAVEKDLIIRLQRKEIDGYINIEKDIFEKNSINYYARNVTNFMENNRIRNALNRAVVKMRILNEGFEHSLVMKLTRGIKFEPVRISEGEKKEGGIETFFVAYVFMFILYMTIVLYGQSVMHSIIEEKTSRVVEVLMSSLKPFDLMAGKIVGISLVGLTQYLVWSIIGITVFSFGQSILSGFVGASADIPNIPSIPPMIFVYFIVYFLLGYFLFSGLFAVAGSIVNNESEARSYMFFIIMPLIIPVLMMPYIIGNPDSLTAVVLSLFPFTSPIIMISRICVSSPPVIEILGSFLILILTIIADIWIVSKIYRVGILMYGKKPSIGEVLKWIRYS